MASPGSHGIRGPHGITYGIVWILWGPSWTCGSLSNADVQRDQPVCPWGWAHGHHILAVAKTGLGTGLDRAGAQRHLGQKQPQIRALAGSAGWDELERCRETRWPQAPIPGESTVSVGGLSASHHGAGASRGSAQGIYPHLFPLLLAQPWLQHKLRFVPLPASAASPLLPPRETPAPPVSVTPSPAEPLLFLGVN